MCKICNCPVFGSSNDAVSGADVIWRRMRWENDHEQRDDRLASVREDAVVSYYKTSWESHKHRKTMRKRSQNSGQTNRYSKGYRPKFKYGWLLLHKHLIVINGKGKVEHIVMQAYWGTGGITPRSLDLGTRYSGKLHALAALFPGKKPLVPIGWENGWAPEWVWTRWWRENSQPPLGLEPRSSIPQSSDIPLSYPGP
jgi:hypothetical protein